MEVLSLIEEFKKYILSLSGKEKEAFEKICLGITHLPIHKADEVLNLAYDRYFKILDELKSSLSFGKYRFVVYRDTIVENIGNSYTGYSFPTSLRDYIHIMPQAITLTQSESVRGAKLKFTFDNICSDCYSLFLVHPSIVLEMMRLDDPFVSVLNGWGNIVKEKYSKFSNISLLFTKYNVRYIIYDKDDIYVRQRGEKLPEEYKNRFNSIKDIGLRRIFCYEEE